MKVQLNTDSLEGRIRSVEREVNWLWFLMTVNAIAITILGFVLVRQG